MQPLQEGLQEPPAPERAGGPGTAWPKAGCGAPGAEDGARWNPGAPATLT